MLIFLIIPIFFVLFQNLSSEKKISLNILKSILCFGLITLVITEFLSLINQLNLYGIIISWLSVFIVLFFLIFKTKSKISKFNFLKLINTFSISEKIYLSIISILFILLFYQGIVYPPNNWDSLTYHMSRIMFWLGNENLNHFPTHILRHLYQPPFAEYLIMNVNVLQGNDYFSNSIQLLFLFFTLISLNEILNWFKIKRINRIITLLFCLTIPSVILQSTTAKNDIICAFFIINSILYFIKCFDKSNKINFAFLGISIGLGMLTKGTFYIFIFPSLLFFASVFFVKNLKQKTYIKILLGFISVFFIFLINIGHFSRNYSVNKNILNIDEVENSMYFNENIDLDLFNSNLLKNIGLEIGFPFFKTYNDIIINYHLNNNIDINNSKTTFLNFPYIGPNQINTNEDLVPNTFHFVLIVFSLVVVCILGLINYKKNIKLLFLIIILIMSVSLFVYLLKWQPWNTRLHIPLFFMFSICIGLLLNKIKYLSFFLIPILLFHFFFYFTFNNLRPIINNKKFTIDLNLTDSRYKKYFANQIHLYPEYLKVRDLMFKNNDKFLGLMISDWEYPLLKDYYYEKINIYCILVGNTSNKIPQKRLSPEAIISNLTNEPYIVFENRTYYNKTPQNKHLWYYN
jgi:4-amino-4-deoxy-L-arabinose transferase-like glycosyltransferase